MALAYEIVTVNRAGRKRARPFATDEPLSPGSVLRLGGRDWLVERVEDGDLPRAVARPAFYRVRLRHPDGREEIGALRRFRPDAPRLGHAFTTFEDGKPASWQVVEESLAHDADGTPFLDLLAERDFAEYEELPDHQLEHALAARDEALPKTATESLRHAEEMGLAVELVALEPGEAPDWAGATSYIDALVLEEIEDDLFELCGVDPDRNSRESWLPTVKERLFSDLELFRADIEGDHIHIQEWQFRDGRIFASVGSPDDEADPQSGHGWMCRLVDAGALGAAGFSRVRKAEL